MIFAHKTTCVRETGRICTASTVTCISAVAGVGRRRLPSPLRRVSLLLRGRRRYFKIYDTFAEILVEILKTSQAIRAQNNRLSQQLRYHRTLGWGVDP